MPADGEPIIGPVAEVPGLYLAVMHSAVTLAAAVGRLVARELVDGTDRAGSVRLPPGSLLIVRRRN